MFFCPWAWSKFFFTINGCCLYSGLKICISIGNLLAVVQFPQSKANVFFIDMTAKIVLDGIPNTSVYFSYE